MARKSRPVQMEALERRLLMDASQLTVVIDSNTLPAVVSDHAALTGKMSMTVSNTSGATQKGKVVVGFLIANGALNVAARNYGVLKSMNTTLSLADGKSQTFNFSIDIGAGKLADGVDTIYAIVVDPTNAFAQATGSDADGAAAERDAFGDGEYSEAAGFDGGGEQGHSDGSGGDHQQRQRPKQRCAEDRPLCDARRHPAALAR